ncbi:turripeptide Gli9.1-like [Agrilus planipennis]|uniref:Turripeptide Gli9.1-like n=1 Tax=Agrilus planipennis TaxID=224129 RepID=A0A1W4WX62_AGRPL|nr:turripeptide Gli9.1-like [Agrilus planipennis]
MKILSVLFLAVLVAQTWSYSLTGPLKRGQRCLLCTEEYEPVCGVNGEGIRKTFGNNCELVQWNCLAGKDYKHISHGVCPESIKSGLLNSTCTIICPNDSHPACGCVRSFTGHFLK